MKKFIVCTAFVIAFALSSMVPNVAHAYAVSCGSEQSWGTGDIGQCNTSGEVYSLAWKWCVNDQGQQCYISWDEIYETTFNGGGYTGPWCYPGIGYWVGNTQIEDGC